MTPSSRYSSAAARVATPSVNIGGAEPVITVEIERVERRAALRVAAAGEVGAEKRQHVEDHVGDRPGGGERGGPVRIADVHAFGERHERGTAGVVEHHDFAVEHAVADRADRAPRVPDRPP